MTTPQEFSSHLTAAVADAMKAAGETQRSVAEKTGIPLVTLNRRLTGRTPFTIPEVAAIAKVVNLSVVELSLRAERATPSPAVA